MALAPDIDTRLAAWTEAGLISAEQGAAIRAWEARSGPGAPAAPATRDRVAGSFGMLGGLLVGLGVLLAVAANWSGIGDGAKVTTIVLALLVAHGIGMWADARGAARWVGTAAFTVATLVFAGGVFLLGQLFNVRAHDPLGFLVVAVTASAVAVLTGRMMVGWIAAAAWLAWGTHELFDLLGNDEEYLSIAGGSILLCLVALSVGWVLDGVAARRSAGRGRALDGPVAADLDVLGTPLRSVALLGMLFVLVPLSFAWHAGEEDLGSGGLDMATLVAAAAALGASVLVARFGSPAARERVGIGIACVAGLVVLAAIAPDGLLIGLIANAVLIAGGIGLALLGLAEDRRDAYMWGVAWIVATIVARYLDVTFSLAFGALGFIGAGLLLIGCGWLVGRSRRIWRTREEE